MKHLFIWLLLCCGLNASAQTTQPVADTSQSGKQAIVRRCTPSRYNALHPPLYVVFYKGKVIVQADNDVFIQKIQPKNIKAIRIFKGDSAIKKYGEKARNGVIEVDLKYHKDIKLFE